MSLWTQWSRQKSLTFSKNYWEPENMHIFLSVQTTVWVAATQWLEACYHSCGGVLKNCVKNKPDKPTFQHGLFLHDLLFHSHVTTSVPMSTQINIFCLNVITILVTQWLHSVRDCSCQSEYGGSHNLSTTSHFGRSGKTKKKNIWQKFMFTIK